VLGYFFKYKTKRMDFGMINLPRRPMEKNFLILSSAEDWKRTNF
jgi:hypothetical protein